MPLWKKVKLGDVLGSKGYIRGPFGSALKRGEMKENGIPVYEQQHAIYNTREFRFFIDEHKFKELKRFQVQVNDLIISCSGTLGKISIIDCNDPKGIISQALLLLRPDTNLILPKYLYYFFLDVNGSNQLLGASHGSVQMNIGKRSTVEDINIDLPDLPTQTRIASILSAFDDKIELNQQMNKTLEEMAQALYKKHFIYDIDPENLPEGWRWGKLTDELEIIMGQSPPGTSYNEEKIGTPFFQGRTDFEFRFPTLRIYTTDPKRMAQKFDTLLSVRAPVGDINIANEYCCIGRGLAAIRHKNGYHSYCFYKLASLAEVLDMYNGEGTVFGSINKEALGSLPTIVPNKENVKKFEDLTQPLDQQIYALSNEVSTLTSIRNSLLPKLMSGEIPVDSLPLIESENTIVA